LTLKIFENKGQNFVNAIKTLEKSTRIGYNRKQSGAVKPRFLSFLQIFVLRSVL